MALSVEEAEKILGLQAELLERVKAGEEEAKKLENYDQRLGETEAAIKKINADWNELEAKAKRPAQAEPNSDEEAEQKKARAVAFKSFVRHGLLRMPKEQREILAPTRAGEEDILALQAKALEIAGGERKVFNIGDDTLGGYFVLPEIVQNEIIKDSVLYTPVREVARVQPTDANSVEIRYRKTTLAAQWVAEAGTRTETTGQTYGNRVIPTHEMYAEIQFTRQQLDDEYFDLEADVAADVAEQFGVTEGAGFVSGTGVGQPNGFVADVPSGNIKTSAGATAIVYADVVGALMKLKPAYRNSPNCTWLLNQAVLEYLREITDVANGRPLLQAWGVSGMQGGWEPTILGKPYMEATDMDSAVTATKVTMAVGDFKKGYRFVDRQQIATLRLNELYAMSGQVGLLFYKRVGGYLVQPEAVALLKQHS
jgi:HK97 family phage major capsid protein